MYRVPDHVRTTHERDGGALLDIFHGRMYDLNPVASRILDLLERGFTETEIVDVIQGEFRIERSIAEQDIEEFLERLKEHGLIIA